MVKTNIKVLFKAGGTLEMHECSPFKYTTNALPLNTQSPEMQDFACT